MKRLIEMAELPENQRKTRCAGHGSHVILGYNWERYTMHMAKLRTVGGSVNIPLRIFDRNQGEKARAGYELQSSQLALTAARNQVLSDVDSSWAGYQTAQTQAARYRSKYLAEASHVRDNIEFSYRNGNATLLDYLSALADYRQINLTALNSDLQLLLSLEQLSYASHTEILP